MGVVGLGLGHAFVDVSEAGEGQVYSSPFEALHDLFLDQEVLSDVAELAADCDVVVGLGELRGEGEQVEFAPEEGLGGRVLGVVAFDFGVDFAPGG